MSADIVIVNDSAFIDGGASKVALSSAIALAGAGWRVTIFAALAPAMPELLNTPNLRVVTTGQQHILTDPSRLRAATQGIWNVRAARELAAVLDGLDPARSIVHFHGWTKSLSPSVLKTAQDRKFRSIITLHEYFTACPLGSFYNHQKKAICELPPLGRRCLTENCDARSAGAKMWRIARQLAQRNIASVPSGIRDFITLSDMSERILAPTLPAAARLHRVNNPVDAEPAPQTDVAANADFTFVGRLSPEKGAVLFASAAREAGVRAVFVGEGECGNDIRAQNGAAELTGWLAREDVRARLSRSRALVFPSLWYETDGLVISEAASLGVPSIVSDVTVAKERVIDGVTGCHFKSGDVASLAGALKRLQADDFARAAGATAYRSYWDAPQTMTEHVADLIDVYERVLAAA